MPSAPKRKSRFVGEPIRPQAGSGSLAAMSRGEPGLPVAFTWRDRRYEIATVVSSWKGHGEDRGDVYVRRHWYDIETACGARMRIYFDRNPGRSKSKLGRWWLFSIDEVLDVI
jgi:Family of unknown function (DUF6504)